MSPDKPNTAPSTSAKESRRTSKPLMEKKRRARINECLAQLKTLVLEAMKKDSSRHSKLEKADILEMTVRHLRSLHRQYVAMAIAADPNVVNKYKAGFSECTSEVTKFLGSVEGIDSSTRSNIVNHLSNCLQNVGSSSVAPTGGASTSTSGTASHVPLQQMQVQIPTFATIPIGPVPSAAISPSIPPNNEVTNNANTASSTVVVPQGIQQLANMYSGLRFLPGTGEIALVLPNQGHISNQIPVIPVYANAMASTAQTATTSVGNTTTYTAPSAAAGSSTSSSVNDITTASKTKPSCECTTGKPTVIVTPSTSSISKEIPITPKKKKVPTATLR